MVIGSVRLGKVLDVPAFPVMESFGCPGFSPGFSRRLFRLLLPDDDSEVKNYFNTGIF